MNLLRMEISFWRHKSKKKGYAQLYLRISIAGDRVDIGSTGITIWYDDWDIIKEQVMSTDPMAHFKNEQLTLYKSRLMAIFSDLFRKQEKISVGKIKRTFLKGDVRTTLIGAFDLYLKDCRTDKSRALDPESVIVYDNCRKKLIDFLLSQKAADLLIEDFDLSWIKRFQDWMFQLPLGRGQIGHAQSYISKHSQIIKNVLVWAKLHKLADINPLEGLRIKGPEYDDPVFLTPEQFQRLRLHRFRSTIVQEAADVFIMLCRTGFHYGDLEDFVQQYHTALQKGLDGKPWLIKKRIKTKIAIRVPVFTEVSEIVSKYGGWENLPMRPLTKFNERLKLVAAELNLPEDLSSKAGRKTFTDWCFNELGLSTDAVLVLLGRKSAKGLEVYGRPDERRVINELERIKKQ